jgi:hypothetical protein
VAGGLGSPLADFSPITEISFLMISPYLLDFCPVYLLVFSLLETADFLMLLKPLGDGYSLLCSQKTDSAAQGPSVRYSSPGFLLKSGLYG